MGLKYLKTTYYSFILYPQEYFPDENNKDIIIKYLEAVRSYAKDLSMLYPPDFALSPLHSGEKETNKLHYHLNLQARADFDSIRRAMCQVYDRFRVYYRVDDLHPKCYGNYPFSQYQLVKNHKQADRYLVHLDHPTKQQFDLTVDNVTIVGDYKLKLGDTDTPENYGAVIYDIFDEFVESDIALTGGIGFYQFFTYCRHNYPSSMNYLFSKSSAIANLLKSYKLMQEQLVFNASVHCIKCKKPIKNANDLYCEDCAKLLLYRKQNLYGNNTDSVI